MSVLNLEMEDTYVAVEDREDPCEYQIRHARNTTRLSTPRTQARTEQLLGSTRFSLSRFTLTRLFTALGYAFLLVLPLLPLLLIALWFGVLGNGALRSRWFPALTFISRSLDQWLSSRLLFPFFKFRGPQNPIFIFIFKNRQDFFRRNWRSTPVLQ